MTRKRTGRRERRASAAPDIEVTLQSVQVFLPPPPLPDNPAVAAAPNGVQREDAVRRRAAQRFSPAFVFLVPDKLQLGSGNRELGDGLIIVGDRVIVLQVKARHPDKLDGTPRARSWIEKESKKALRQAKGTVTKLRTADRPIELEMVDPYAGLESLRLHLEAGVACEYFGVIVVDHTSDEADVAPLDLTDVDFPVVRMGLDEWDYIVSNCDSATELWEYLIEHGAGEDSYRQQRGAFATSPIGAKFQPVAVDESRLPAPSEGLLLGTFEIPSAAAIDPVEEMMDSNFRHRVFGSLLHEVLQGAPEAPTLKILASLDGLPAKERREHERQWQEQLTTCKATGAAAVVETQSESGPHLVELIVIGSLAEHEAFIGDRMQAVEQAVCRDGGGTILFLATEVQDDNARVHAAIKELGEPTEDSLVVVGEEVERGGEVEGGDGS